MTRRERPPPEHRQTWRDALYFALQEGPKTIRELSVELGAKERDLLDHLLHLERSLERTGEHLLVEPSRCLACGFLFEERSRLTRPGRCPACKATRITPPRFAVEQDAP